MAVGGAELVGVAVGGMASVDVDVGNAETVGVAVLAPLPSSSELQPNRTLPRLSRTSTVLTEGFITYGGLAGRDLEAMAQGFEEVVHDDYLAYRIRSVEYLGEKLVAAGIPIVEPPGGHAIYIDAARMCPHIPARQFPGQAVVCGLYRTGGIRSVEIGSVMFGCSPGVGAERPRLELVRLAIPRRVYTQSHIDYVVEASVELFHRRGDLRGLHMTYEPPVLRHFTARFEECG